MAYPCHIVDALDGLAANRFVGLISLIARRVAITALLTLAFETRIDAWSGRLQRPRTQPRVDNPLGLRNNFLCAIFLQLGGAIG